MTDQERGTKALKAYYGYMRSMYPSTFKYSEAEFFVILSKIKGGKALADGLGGGIREVGMSDSEVNTSMRRIAQVGAGKIPATYYDFFSALINEATKFNLADAAAFTIVESGKQVLGAAQDVGNQLIFTGRIVNFFLPLILIFIGLVFLNKFTDGAVVKVFKSFKK